MRKTIVKRIYLFCLLAVTLFASMIFLAGCQSTDKAESYLNTSKIESTQFEYDSTNDQTKVIWGTTLTNNTIYNIKGFSVRFKLYHGDSLVNTETYNYSRGVKHGGNYTGLFNFYADGEIDSIEYVSWTANYNSFWGTYKIWFIVTIVIACIASLIYIIVMIIQDLELDDIGEFLSDNWWIAFSLLVPLGGTIWGIVTSYWVPILIVLGGIVAFILIALIAHLVRFIVGYMSYNAGLGKYNEDFDDDDEDEDEDFDDDDDFEDDDDFDSTREEVKEKNTNKTAKKAPSRKCSNITFDDIAGLEEAKSAFKEKVVYAFEHKELYEKYGKKVGGGLLLYGLPGTGKTMFAEAASNETDSLFIPIKCSDIKSKWYGESEENVKKVFAKARKAKKAIIFFDEFEAIGAKRIDNGEWNGNNDLVPQILAEMQGVGSSSSNSVIMVIAATNKPWAIDSAFLRPGRFDEKIYIPLPDLEARKRMFQLKLKSVPQEGLDFDYLASITDGFNGADIGAFCDKLKMLAINKSIAANMECPITMNEVTQVQDSIKSSVSDEDIERLLEFKEQYR
ncbi:MAG: ATP-binding protein [Clostridia bacterium]|nr:ATP-binding protein [Clostridia bacterium]